MVSMLSEFTKADANISEAQLKDLSKNVDLSVKKVDERGDEKDSESSFIAAFIAIPVVAYLALIVYKTPGLCKMIVDIGVDMIKSGKTRVEAFNEIADAVKA